MKYKERFLKAIELADQWQVSAANDFEPATPADAKLSDYLSVINLFFTTAPKISEIRLECAKVHFALWEALQIAGLPSFLTIGDVVTEKSEPIFNTTIESLAAEWNSEYYNSSKNVDLHVWLTLPDLETVIDATIIPHIMGNSSEVFDSSKHLFISDPEGMDTQHQPLLIGITFLFQSGAIPMPYHRY